MNDVQKKILEIFKVVAEICESNNIRYYAIGGTCLGAVRHKGFIPWDDDLDIALPIEDYMRFLEIAPEKLPKYLEIVKPDTFPHFDRFFIRVMDNRTTFIQEKYLVFKNTYSGVWIDIMPLPGIPEKAREKEKFIKRRNIYLD